MTTTPDSHNTAPKMIQITAAPFPRCAKQPAGRKHSNGGAQTLQCRDPAGQSPATIRLAAGLTFRLPMLDEAAY
jgi:hypothetical protein